MGVSLLMYIMLGISIGTMIYLAYKAGHRYELVGLILVTTLFGCMLLIGSTGWARPIKQPYVVTCDSTEVVIYAPVDTIRTLQYEIEWE